MFLLRRPAQLLLWAAWACEWDPTYPLTAELSRLSESLRIYRGLPNLYMHAPHPTPHTFLHIYTQHLEAGVSTQQLPNTGITSANNPFTSEANPTQKPQK